MAEFECILTKILSADKSERESAENHLDTLLKTSAEQVLTHLIRALFSDNEELSILSTILIRKKFSEEDFLSKVPNSTIQSAKKDLLSLILPSKSPKLLKRIGDILVNFSLLHR